MLCLLVEEGDEVMGAGWVGCVKIGLIDWVKDGRMKEKEKEKEKENNNNNDIEKHTHKAHNPSPFRLSPFSVVQLHSSSFFFLLKNNYSPLHTHLPQKP